MKSENEDLDIHKLALIELKNIDKGRMISLKDVFYRLGIIFHFNKEQSYKIIKSLEKKGFIEFFPYNGIRVINRSKNGPKP
jgi:hypothetical protein